MRKNYKPDSTFQNRVKIVIRESYILISSSHKIFHQASYALDHMDHCT